MVEFILHGLKEMGNQRQMIKLWSLRIFDIDISSNRLTSENWNDEERANTNTNHRPCHTFFVDDLSLQICGTDWLWCNSFDN
mmetsp:Transcript_27886/g.43849  ORF Transcript_27886/g.43849 Transcript_27886/m.43849 type:complete len:82 (+) Transcript_27886:20-265(+)